MFNTMDSRCHLSRLPTELLCMILDYIPDNDRISFKFAYPQFFNQHRSINIREVFAQSEERIDRLLVHHPSPDILTHLDLNFCYWLPSDILINFIKRCNNLKSLAVAHTSITCADLANILHHSSISKLSFSVHSKAFWINEKQVVKYLNYFCQSSNYKIANASASWHSLLSFSHFGKCKHFLTKLTSLDLYIPQDAILLGSFLSACDNVEHLCLRTVQGVDRASEYMKFLSNIITQKAIMDALESNPLKPGNHFRLKSFVLVNYDEKVSTLETHMQRLVERIIGPLGHRLQCLWTSLPFTVSKNELFDATSLVAWRETKWCPEALPFNMSQMESLVSNKYMHRGDFSSPELKFVECGFWKDNFKTFCKKHTHLERVRLNKRPCENSELFSVIEWFSLPRLKTLSLHPRVIYTSDYLQNSWMRNRAERALCNLLESYPALEELEICPDHNETPELIIRNLRDTFINADCLSRLKVCHNLKKFTIRLTTISYKKEELNEPPFLEEIITKCPNLESLNILDINISITYHGVRERSLMLYDATYNDCIDRCIKAAQSRDKLRFLRLQFRTSQSYEVVMRRLSGYFPALVQFALILTNDQCRPAYENFTEEEFALMCKSLVENKPKLMAVLVVLPGVPASLCGAATRALEAAYRPMRPCFSALVTNSLEGAMDSSSLPWIHCQSLAGDPRSLNEFPLHFTGLHCVRY